MLELLEKRGPKAFDNFILILKENFDWLADMLEKEFQHRRRSARLENSKKDWDGRILYHSQALQQG